VAPKPLYFYELPVEPQSVLARETNIGLAEFCAVRPDRLRWMAHVPLAWPEQSVTILEEAMQLGAAGVQIGPSADGKRLDEPEYEPFWAAVERLHVPVFLHPGCEPKDRGFEKYGLGTIALERLIGCRLFDRFPDLRMVVAYGGGVFPYNVRRSKRYVAVTESLRSIPSDPWSYVGRRIMFDSLVYDIETLRFLVDKAGSENVMIGTDCSFSSAAIAPMEELRAAISDQRALQRAAEGNAAQLFGFRDADH
jgi:aminocarboxymuconate-semialdehyde decarboxylase